MRGGVGEAGWGHPVRCALPDAEGMFVADARIAGEAGVATELQRVPAFGPGKVVSEIVNRSLRIVAVNDALIEAIENIPLLVGISQYAGALASEAPMKAVDH